MNRKKAFTLTELMVVVILIGIIAAFALPNYNKSIAKAHERDAIVQLMAIHAACKIYNAQAGHYPENTLDIDGINDELGLNVIANGMIYNYSTHTTSPDEFDVTAEFNDGQGGNIFTIRINQDPIQQGGVVTSSNPCCSSGGDTCPSLPACND